MPERDAVDKKKIREGGSFQIISTKDGSTTDQCCFVLHIRHSPANNFVLLLEIETLFPTRNEASMANCSAHYRKLSPFYD